MKLIHTIFININANDMQTYIQGYTLTKSTQYKL